MSDENLHRQKFTIEQWPTSKVTLYPTRASVVRQIEAIKLKPGLNEITISDLTSLADPDSIRVAGTTDDNPARINDLTVDLVPNPYSHLADDDDDEESEDEESDDEEPEALKVARSDLLKVNKTISETKERKAASEKELTLLQQYAQSASGSTPEKTSPKTMKETLELFASHRKTHFDIIESCTNKLTDLEKERQKAVKNVAVQEKKYQRLSRKKVQARERKKAEKEERRRERKESKPEKSPNVHRVRITIEVPGVEHSLKQKQKAQEIENAGAGVAGATEFPIELAQEATLILTYTTSSASWTPHYDLRLDTTNPARSTLTYRAHFINRTYETWSNAQLTLSTSQASFGGLNEKIPRMESWRVNLLKTWSTDVERLGANGLFSLAEQKLKEAEQKALYEVNQDQRQNQYLIQNQKEMAKNMVSQQQSTGNMLLKSKKAKAGFFASSNIAPSAAPVTRGGVALGWGGGTREELDESAGSVELMDSLHEEVDADGVTLAAGGKLIAHAAAGADTYGFTTTYELPTPRTVPSTALVRRHVIAEIPLPSLMFTHIVLPKLKAAAFLKARMTNTSTIPLLPGVAGLTLDGSFLGNLSFPRCSPDETVVLELGVDQSVKVEYERPTVKRGSQGMMIIGKEEVGVFKRTMRITNTKSASVSLVVLDQVPVPEDEKLKVSILAPKGLKAVDDVARSGVGVDGKAPTVKVKKPKLATDHAPSASISGKLDSVTKLDSVAELPSPASSSSNPLRSTIRRFPSFSAKRDSTSQLILNPPIPPVPAPPAATTAPNTSESTAAGKGSSGNWGTAKATLRKNGEIRFDVDLLKGGCVSIGLEWECRMPSGDGICALS